MPKIIVYCYNYKCLHNPAGLCIRGFIQLNCMGMCNHFIVKAGKEAGHYLTSQSRGQHKHRPYHTGGDEIICADCGELCGGQ